MAAPTARLLGRYLTNRTHGPVFLTRWRTRTAPARRDLYEATGQARLSYRTAATEFRKHSGGWTLHQLRHSSLTHLAEAGASAVMLQAKSRHRDLRTLSVYTRPGVEAVARLTDERFDHPSS
ncbi:MAG: tyrosine-type recombinase/integrase [bacterium]|nr:tyrosine-type recombinase/integrase [bacterium]